MSKSRKSSRSNRSEGDWLTWLATADPTAREALRGEVQAIKEAEYEGGAELSKIMIQGLISGTISPSISEEARGWAEIMLAAQATQLALAKPEGDASSTSIILALGDLQKKEAPKIEAQYTIEAEIDAEKSEFEQLLARGK